MKNLSKLLNKNIHFSRKRLSVDQKLQLLNVSWRLSSFRRLLLSFVGRLSTVFRGHQTPVFRHFIIYKKYTVVWLDTKNPFLGPAATTIIQIQVIAVQKFRYAVFTQQIMV